MLDGVSVVSPLKRSKNCRAAGRQSPCSSSPQGESLPHGDG